MLSHHVADLFKGLAKVQYGLGGIYLSKNKQGEARRLKFAVDLVDGRAIILKLTAKQAAYLTNVPLTTLQGALTRGGLRTRRKAQLSSQPAPVRPPRAAKNSWSTCWTCSVPTSCSTGRWRARPRRAAVRPPPTALATVQPPVPTPAPKET